MNPLTWLVMTIFTFLVMEECWSSKWTNSFMKLLWHISLICQHDIWWKCFKSPWIWCRMSYGWDLFDEDKQCNAMSKEVISRLPCILLIFQKQGKRGAVVQCSSQDGSTLLRAAFLLHPPPTYLPNQDNQPTNRLTSNNELRKCAHKFDWLLWQDIIKHRTSLPPSLSLR